jgi:hypothetical protein
MPEISTVRWWNRLVGASSSNWLTVRAAVVDAGKTGEATSPPMSNRDGPSDHPVAFTSVIRILFGVVFFVHHPSKPD